jgi:hypothetical protein
MLTYICSLPNIKHAGRIPYLISDDPAAIEAFARKWDVPGRGVFECVGPLLPGATARNLTTVAGADKVYTDTDVRSLVEPREAVLRKLQQLPMRAEIRSSGDGFHVVWRLKEFVARDTEEFRQLNQLRTRITYILCGDPEPNHAAALIRKIGTHNSRYNGELRQVGVIQEAQPVTILDLEEMLDTLGSAPLFTLRPKPKTNGHVHAAGAPHTPEDHKPINAEERLADMAYKGPGDSAVHRTQLQVSASLLRNGQCVESVVDEMLNRTQDAVAGDRRATDWDWAKERHDIEEMCFSFISKTPSWLRCCPTSCTLPGRNAWRLGG